MNPALWAAKTGLDAQQTQARRHLQQPGQRQHRRLQEGPRRVRGPAVPEHPPGRRLDLAGHAGAHRACTSAPACASSPPKRSTRRAASRRPTTRSTWPSKAAASSRSRCPTAPPAYTRDGNFQLNAQGQMVTSSGYVLQPGISDSRRRAVGHDRPRRRGQRRVAGQDTPVQVGQLQLTDFINPAGLEPLGENLLVETAASGPAQTGTRRPERPRHDAAGLLRILERQRGRRAGQHDRDAARLRDELQGDLDRRPDARIRQQPAVNAGTNYP